MAKPWVSPLKYLPKFNLIPYFVRLIVCCNLPMVMNIVINKFNTYDFDEFISAGNDALLTAIRLYDVSQKTRFTTYAYISIKNKRFLDGVLI